MAVVTCGILLARGQRGLLSARTRTEARSTWAFVEFALTSLVFILVGLQLNGILERLGPYATGFLALAAGALSATLILSRLAWLMPLALLPRLIPAMARDDGLPRPREAAVIGWAGMRGVVSLATAIALPLETPHRELLVFLAFIAILATLVVQGTTLEWVIRRLHVALPTRAGMDREEAAARRLMAHAALAEVQSRLDSPLDGAIARDLVAEFGDIARVYSGVAAGGAQAEMLARLQIRLAAIRRARQALLGHQSDSMISEDMLAGLLAETDHEELRLLRQIAQAR